MISGSLYPYLEMRPTADVDPSGLCGTRAIGPSCVAGGPVVTGYELFNITTDGDCPGFDEDDFRDGFASTFDGNAQDAFCTKQAYDLEILVMCPPGYWCKQRNPTYERRVDWPDGHFSVRYHGCTVSFDIHIWCVYRYRYGDCIPYTTKGWG